MKDKLETILEILSDAKASNVRVCNIGAISSVADAFVLATGDVGKHIDSMADAIRRAFKTSKEREDKSGDHSMSSSGRTRSSVEGNGASGWVLIDLGDIVVHLFTPERRSHYALDELWSETASSVAGTRS